MIGEGLKLTGYFGERDRLGSRFVADVLAATFARHELRTSVVMRGTEGFGLAGHLRTDRLLSSSEDLPLVAVAVDRRSRIEAALQSLASLEFNGLLTLERARLVEEQLDAPPEPPWAGEAETKLTVYVGRHQRLGGMRAYERIVAMLREHRLAGATVLLGVDGTLNGVRRRARFFGANSNVPLMVVAVGETSRITSIVPELSRLPDRPLITLERVQVCKRDGRLLGPPLAIRGSDPSGLGVWQKLMVYSSEQSRHHGSPAHEELIAQLLHARAAGATCLRGVWGYHGEHGPHGDRFWQLRRRVPVVTVIVDTPERMAGWFEIVDAVTDEGGLVTSEMVPAYRATAGERLHGGLRLADPHG